MKLIREFTISCKCILHQKILTLRMTFTVNEEINKEIVKIHILQPEADQYMILPYKNMYKIKNIYTLHNKKKKK